MGQNTKCILKVAMAMAWDLISQSLAALLLLGGQINSNGVIWLHCCPVGSSGDIFELLMGGLAKCHPMGSSRLGNF